MLAIACVSFCFPCRAQSKEEITDSSAQLMSDLLPHRMRVQLARRGLRTLP